MAQLLEYIKMAIDNILANKGRSILTMLGIIIGISSVIMIMSIGSGAKGQISDELNAIAGGQIYIYANDSAENGTQYITPEDMEAIKEKVEHVKGVTPADSLWGTVRTNKGNFELSASSGTADLKYISNPTMKRGRYFTDEDVEAGSLVGVISENDARTLFGTDDVVGMTVEATVYNITQEITIIGVTESPEDSAMTAMLYGTDRVSMDVPYTMNYAFGYIMDEFYAIYVISEGGPYTSVTAAESKQLLEQRHQVTAEDDAYMVQDFDSQMAQINQVLDMLTIFIALVAAISLLVGGIGVMNIMLVSVTERTREIGIRKALGARTGSIMLQFLSESAIITAIGGIIGIILGILGAKAICSLPIVGFSPRISLFAVVAATLFSSAVGVFFGIYPAKKAARLSPIEALRRN